MWWRKPKERERMQAGRHHTFQELVSWERQRRQDLQQQSLFFRYVVYYFLHVLLIPVIWSLEHREWILRQYVITFISVSEDCFDEGRCKGEVVSVTITNSSLTCQSKCLSIDGCGYFTFDSTNNICTLTTDCESTRSCESCINGPSICVRREPGKE